MDPAWPGAVSGRADGVSSEACAHSSLPGNRRSQYGVGVEQPLTEAVISGCCFQKTQFLS